MESAGQSGRLRRTYRTCQHGCEALLWARSAASVAGEGEEVCGSCRGRVEGKEQLVRLVAVFFFFVFCFVLGFFFGRFTALLRLIQVCSRANLKCELKPGKTITLVGNESREMDGNSARRARRFTVYTPSSMDRVVLTACLRVNGKNIMTIPNVGFFNFLRRSDKRLSEASFCARQVPLCAHHQTLSLKNTSL